MFPAAFCAGMTLPLITYALLRARRTASAPSARCTPPTRWARSLGVLLAAHVGLPLLGLKGTIIAGAAVDVAARPRAAVAVLGRCAGFAGRRRASRRDRCSSRVAIGGAARPVQDGLGRVPPRRALSRRADAKLIFYKDGKTATVSLVDFAEGRQHPHQRQVRRRDQHGPDRRSAPTRSP